MYVLARREGESIILAHKGEKIRIKITSVTGKIARVGIDAHRDIFIAREETLEGSRRDVDDDEGQG